MEAIHSEVIAIACRKLYTSVVHLSSVHYHRRPVGSGGQGRFKELVESAGLVPCRVNLELALEEVDIGSGLI